MSIKTESNSPGPSVKKTETLPPAILLISDLVQAEKMSIKATSSDAATREILKVFMILNFYGSLGMSPVGTIHRHKWTFWV
jgi:hypothetical protein